MKSKLYLSKVASNFGQKSSHCWPWSWKLRLCYARNFADKRVLWKDRTLLHLIGSFFFSNSLIKKCTFYWSFVVFSLEAQIWIFCIRNSSWKKLGKSQKFSKHFLKPQFYKYRVLERGNRTWSFPGSAEPGDKGGPKRCKTCSIKYITAWPSFQIRANNLVNIF